MEGLHLTKRDKREVHLHVLAGSGDVAGVFQQINQGADVNLLDDHGQTALCWAAARGQKDVVQLFVNNGVDVNKYDGDGSPPLFHAAFHGFVDICEILVKAGADINKANKRNVTALMYAVIGEQLNAVRWFLGNGADVTMEDWKGRSALQIADEEGKTKVVATIEDFLGDMLENR